MSNYRKNGDRAVKFKNIFVLDIKFFHGQILYNIHAFAWAIDNIEMITLDTNKRLDRRDPLILRRPDNWCARTMIYEY